MWSRPSGPPLSACGLRRGSRPMWWRPLCGELGDNCTLSCHWPQLSRSVQSFVFFRTGTLEQAVSIRDDTHFLSRCVLLIPTLSRGAMSGGGNLLPHSALMRLLSMPSRSVCSSRLAPRWPSFRMGRHTLLRPGAQVPLLPSSERRRRLLRPSRSVCSGRLAPQ